MGERIGRIWQIQTDFLFLRIPSTRTLKKSASIRPIRLIRSPIESQSYHKIPKSEIHIPKSINSCNFAAILKRMVENSSFIIHHSSFLFKCTHSAMIQYYARIEGKLRPLVEAETGCWINVSAPIAREEVLELAEKYAIPIDFLTDPQDIDERARHEREDEMRLIILNSPVLNNNIDKDTQAIYMTIPLGIIITIDHVITISAFENPVIDQFLEDKVKNFDPSDDKLFVLQILAQNIQRYLNGLKQLNYKRNVIEKELYASSRNMEIKQLLSIEKSLVYFVNSLYAIELLAMKMKRIDFLHIRDDEDKMDLFEDIIIDNSQALDMAKVYTDILGGTMDAYASIISNNLNIVMKRLTTITIVLMVPTLIASFFGMNVKMPFFNTDHPMAFFTIVLISLIMSILTSWFFRKKDLSQ
jgi:magnesium transporter